MSIQKPPTVKVWQHREDPHRILITWDDGKTIVVTCDYIEPDPQLESPDAWMPIGKPQHATGGSVRSVVDTAPIHGR